MRQGQAGFRQGVVFCAGPLRLPANLAVDQPLMLVTNTGIRSPFPFPNLRQVIRRPAPGNPGNRTGPPHGSRFGETNHTTTPRLTVQEGSKVNTKKRNRHEALPSFFAGPLTGLALLLVTVPAHATRNADFYVATPPSSSYLQEAFASGESACEAIASASSRYEVEVNFYDPEHTSSYGTCNVTVTNPYTGFSYVRRAYGSVLPRSCDTAPSQHLAWAEGLCQKDEGPPAECGQTNPINLFTGFKYQRETDYASHANPHLRIERAYFWDGAEGVWRFAHRPAIETREFVDNTLVMVHRSDLSVLSFNGTLAKGFAPASDVVERLVALDDGMGNVTGWALTLGDDGVEAYDAQGRLASVTDRDGVRNATLSYDTLERTSTLSDRHGQSIVLGFDADGRIVQATDPHGRLYTYAYDANGMLATVTYPDDTPADPNDNPTRLYHYENTALPQALTGITDERGLRTATWTYDAQGRAISSEHGAAGSGIERVSIDYTHLEDPEDPRVTLTNPLGKQALYHYENIQSVRRTVLVEGQASPYCAAAEQARRYDRNGFLDAATDWEGNVSAFVHDDRGLQTARTEAVGTPQERTITTEWHPSFRLPTRITQPGRETSFTYNEDGQLLTRTERDLANGNTRTTTYRYNAEGLLAAIDGPRTDVADLTTLTYDAAGNRASLTDPLGQVTRFSAYDPSGRVLELIDPNEVTSARLVTERTPGSRATG